MKEELDMAYAAGILDGDGSFSLLLHRSVTKNTWRSFYHPCIQLSNAYKGMSEFLKEKFGGSLRIKKPQRDHHKVLYVWSLRSREGCKNLIDKILPYLKLKNDQAKLMLEFLTIDHFNQHEGEKYNLKMKNLNRDILFNPDGFKQKTLIDSKDPVFWSYFSGIMDTEGSFSIKKEKPHSGSISVRYNPLIQLTMVPAACINYIRENYSVGSFCVPKANCTGKGYAYKMNLCGIKKCTNFINNILPYIRFKKKQATLILKFCTENMSTKYRQGGIPVEIIKFREELYEQMKMLNNTPS
jgi:hypothetical protein